MKKRMTTRKLALLTGISIVIMTIAAGATMGGVFAPLFEMNPEEFSQHIPSIESNYFYGILGWFIILITDVIVSWGLYKFYAIKNKQKSLIMGLLRMVYSVFLFIGIVQLMNSYMEISGAEKNMERAQELLLSFQSIWHFGLIIFGLHLLLLSPLVCEKGKLNQVIAALIFLAGIGYVGSNIADLFISDFKQIRPQVEAYFIIPMIFGEFGLAIWLIIKGGKKKDVPKTQYAS
jgi:hypothetical protein